MDLNAWKPDTQALTMLWTELSEDIRKRGTRIADGFKVGSGDKLLSD